MKFESCSPTGERVIKSCNLHTFLCIDKVNLHGLAGSRNKETMENKKLNISCHRRAISIKLHRYNIFSGIYAHNFLFDQKIKQTRDI